MKFSGITTVAITDPFRYREPIPVLLDGERIGRAVSMDKMKLCKTPYLCFEADIIFEELPEILRGKFDGLHGDAKGCTQDDGIHIAELHLHFGKNIQQKRKARWIKQISMSTIVRSLPCLKK